MEDFKKEKEIFRFESYFLGILIALLTFWGFAQFFLNIESLEPILTGLFLTVAIAGSITAYSIYFRDLHRSIITPDRWSWLIWSAAAIVEALTYQALNADLIKSVVFIISGFACVLITARVWARAKWKSPDWTEIFCMATSGISLLLWLQFHETLWAHMLVTLAVPIAFIPTWKGAMRYREHSQAWGVWTISDMATLAVILIRFTSLEELPYIIIELISHAVVWMMIIRQRSYKRLAKIEHIA